MTTETPAQNKLPIVAIVGRPNVGKSSLFNKIVHRRIAIVHEESGITRDRVTSIAESYGKYFLVIDTGGLGIFPGEKAKSFLDSQVIHQLEAAIETADRLIFVVDVQAGLTPLDIEISRLLRASETPVHVVANKADNVKLETAADAISPSWAVPPTGFGS